MGFDDTIVFRGTHWVTVDGETLTIGLTEDAVAEFDEIDSIEFPEDGDSVSPDEACGVLKASGRTVNLYSPVNGEIVDVNSGLNDDPSLLEEDPIGEGWLFKVEANDSDEVSQLLSGDEPEFYDDADDTDDESFYGDVDDDY